MSTDVRADISEKNKWWISKHRYYELKHFCLQYPTWKKAYLALNGYALSKDFGGTTKTNRIYDPTEKCVEARAYYLDRMRMVEQAALKADPDLAHYILLGVTESIPYDTLRMKKNIPCGKNTYYDRYRKFFWLLNKKRG